MLEDGIEAAWVNKEGTSADFDSCIDVEAAFWDPDGKALFGDDEDPDDEEENYTGNEGVLRGGRGARFQLLAGLPGQFWCPWLCTPDFQRVCRKG